jgi:putative transposase
MSELRKRNVPTAEFKAKVGLWKKEILEGAKTLFEGKRGPKPVAAHLDPERLYGEIGKLKVELDWLKKVRDRPAMTRQAWIGPANDVAVVRQCELAGVSRTTHYAQRVARSVDEADRLVSRLIDEEYTRHPFYGTRSMAAVEWSSFSVRQVTRSIANGSNG